MTDILPSRQAAPLAAHPAQPPAVPFSDVMQQCNAMAGAGDLIPLCYRGKPGAVLLAKMWADRHIGGDVFTAMQHIYPIQGKPYVSAEMRVELASAKGYDIETLISDDARCVLKVTDPQGRVRHVEAVMPNSAPENTSGIVVRPAQEDLAKTTWKNRPGDMLYALACRVADRRLVRSGAALLDAAQDYATDPDPLDVLTPAQSPAEGDDEVTDAEVVTDDDDASEGATEPAQEQPAAAPTATPEERTEFLLSVAGASGHKTKAAVLKLAREQGHQVDSFDALVADQVAYDAVLDALEGP
ncbi:MAG: hypothetical protein ACRCW4_00465 [Candidatus Neomicrothrix subdominans]